MNYKLTITTESGKQLEYLLTSGQIENLNNVTEVANCFLLNEPNGRQYIVNRIQNGSFHCEVGNFTKRYDNSIMNWIIE